MLLRSLTLSAGMLLCGIGQTAQAQQAVPGDAIPELDEILKLHMQQMQQLQQSLGLLQLGGGGNIQLLQPGLPGIGLPGGIGFGSIVQMKQLQKMIREMQQNGGDPEKMAQLQKQLQQLGGLGGLHLRIGPGGGGANLGNGGGRAPRANATQELRLGALLETPNSTLVEQLDLPKDQGIVLNDVLPDSAAAKAGLKAHDIVLEVDGKTVSNKVADFNKQIGEIKAGTPVEVVVLRKGKRETIKGLSLPEGAPQNGPPQANPNAPKPDPKRAAPGIF